MKNKIIVFFVLLLIIAGSLTFIYYRYEKPTQMEDLEYTNLSVSARLDDSLIVTGYKITRDGYFYREGETLEGGAILVPVLINSTYKIESVNLENQSYYTAFENIDVRTFDIYRSELDIIPPGEIDVSHVLEKTNDRVVLEISSVGPYNDISYCLDWSRDFVWVKGNDTKSAILYTPEAVYCYDTHTSLNSNGMKIYLDFKYWSSLDEDDEIVIYILDKGIENNEMSYINYGGNDIQYTVFNI